MISIFLKYKQNGTIKENATNVLRTFVVNNEELKTNYYGWTFAGEVVKNLDKEWAITGTGALSLYRAKSEGSTSYTDGAGNSFSRSLSKNTLALNSDLKLSYKIDDTKHIALNGGIDSLRYAPKVNYLESTIDDGDLFGYHAGVRFIWTFVAGR